MQQRNTECNFSLFFWFFLWTGRWKCLRKESRLCIFSFSTTTYSNFASMHLSLWSPCSKVMTNAILRYYFEFILWTGRKKCFKKGSKLCIFSFSTTTFSSFASTQLSLWSACSKVKTNAILRYFFDFFSGMDERNVSKKDLVYVFFHSLQPPFPVLLPRGLVWNLHASRGIPNAIIL